MRRHSIHTMSNIREVGNRSSTAHFYFFANGLNGLHNQIISSLNVLIAITSFPGNLFIIVALQKVTSIHPPSKLLFSCLASIDGSLRRNHIAAFVYRLFVVSALIQSLLLSGICFSNCGLISLRRIFTHVNCNQCEKIVRAGAWVKIQTNHHQETGLGLSVIFSWLGSSSNAVVYLYGYRILLSTASAIMLLCISTSTFCYVKIYRIFRHHQFQVQERIYLSRPNRKQVPINIARYRKTVSSALWISLELLVCYLPFVIMIFIEYITYAPIFTLFF